MIEAKQFNIIGMPQNNMNLYTTVPVHAAEHYHAKCIDPTRSGLVTIIEAI